MTIRRISLNSVGDVKAFVDIMRECPHKTNLKVEGYIVDAKSIMGVFSLNLVEPIKLEIEAEEADCKATLDAIANYIVG